MPEGIRPIDSRYLAARTFTCNFPYCSETFLTETALSRHKIVHRGLVA